MKVQELLYEVQTEVKRKVKKSQVLLDLQRNSIEVGGPGVGQGQLGEQGSQPGSAG